MDARTDEEVQQAEAHIERELVLAAIDNTTTLLIKTTVEAAGAKQFVNVVTKGIKPVSQIGKGIGKYGGGVLAGGISLGMDIYSDCYTYSGYDKAATIGISIFGATAAIILGALLVATAPVSVALFAGAAISIGASIGTSALKQAVLKRRRR